MGLLDKIIGKSERRRDHPAKADKAMQAVLDAYAALDPKPIELCTPEEARRQPTPADAVKSILARTPAGEDPSLGVETRDLEIPTPNGGLKARLYRPAEATERLPIVVYFHGGGWVIANLDVYDASPRGIAKSAGCLVVSVHYRQAPEHKFPAAHEDAFQAWKWVVDNAQDFGGDPSRVSIMGESAGGNLACATAIRARDEGVQTPCHQVLVYPVAGADMSRPSYVENATARPLNKAMMSWFIQHVFHDPAELEDPRINLVEADLIGLPSATVILAEIDPLRSEGECLIDRLEQAGVDVRHKTYHGSTHEFFAMALVVPDAAAAQQFAARELKRAWGEAGARN